MSDGGLLKALEELQDDWEQRDTPSPSTVGGCLRRQWFTARKVARTERVSPSSILSFERGTALEPLIHELCRREGYAVSPSVTLPQSACDYINCKRGAVDALLVKDGVCRLLEVKVLGMWGYKIMHRDGLEKDLQYYTQVQLYMAALSSLGDFITNLGPCLYVVVSADHSAHNWYHNRMEKLLPDDPKRLPPLFSFDVPFDSHNANVVIGRAHLINSLVGGQTSAKAVPRDADPWKDNFPCNWCGYKAVCMEAG